MMSTRSSPAANERLMDRRAAAVPRGVSQAHPVFASRALGAELWDVEGRRYIDFCGGIAVVNTGHCHPDVVEAVDAQLRAYTHTCFQVVAYESYVALAERLNALAPGAAPKKTMFMTTGAEAVENAIKIARAYTRRSGVIAFSGAFHGRTMMALALTGKVHPYKAAFGPFPGEVFHAPFPSASSGIGVDASIRAIERLLKSDIEASRVAACIVEPVLGEGGYHPAPPEFLRRLRALCDEHGILLIADEIQTGIGRTGRMFAVEHSGVVPDIVTLAKGLGGGLPISAIVGRADVMDAAHPGGLGGTYAGSPLGCAAALAVLDAIERDDILAQVERSGERMRARLRELAARHPAIGDVRGLGLMNAIELFHDAARTQPAPELAARLLAEARNRGLLLLACGDHGNVIRFMCPLTTPQTILDEGLDRLGDALSAIAPATARVAHAQPAMPAHTP
jgi:4-aminobutyrate aminotransferase / (S)-3-amino-2-methylpropionate transaminase / 5-aminovalerate transaminase